MHIHLTSERSALAWFLRVLIGPSMIIDGAICFITLGTISFGLCLKCARALARRRMPA
jgi:hypothetical protein